MRDYEIGIEKFGNFDLIKLAYMHRNAVVHDGTSDPSLASPDYANFLTVSYKNINEITNELQELVNFVIRLYLRKSASQATVP